MKKFWLLFLISIFLFIYAYFGEDVLANHSNKSTGQFFELLKLSPSGSLSQFGGNSDIDGDFVVVGSKLSDDARLFYRNAGGVGNWGQVKIFDPSDDAKINGHTIAVGVRIPGHVEIYEKDQGGIDNWGLTTIITPTDTTSNFGEYVDLDGDTLLVGARGDSENGANAGAAYIFERNQGGADQWGQVIKIKASDGVSNDLFGMAVSIQNNTAVVGAPQALGFSDPGKAYIFERNQGGANNWGEVKIIFSSNGIGGDRYGSAVDVYGDHVVVGAFLADEFGADAGAAYIYGRNHGGVENWGKVKTIFPSDGENGDQFGMDVTIHNDLAIIGSPSDNSFGNDSGSAYVFYQDASGIGNWGFIQEVKENTPVIQGTFGTSLSFDGITLVVGAPLFSGEAFLFGQMSNQIYLPIVLRN